MDRLAAMAVFAQVVDAGSLSAAADQMGLSRSTVSKHLAWLEERLGVRLINRTTRRLSLTAVGAEFYQRCARVIHDAEEAERAASQLRGVPRGPLRVNAPMTFGQLHIAPAIPAFLERYPQVSVDLVLNDRFVDLIEGRFDVGVRVANMHDSSLVARRLAPNRVVVCAAPAYLARHGVPRLPADLKQHNCLCYTYLSTRNAWRFVASRRKHSVTVAGNFQANNGDSLLAAAIAGLGLVQLPSFIAFDALRSGKLRPVLEAYEDRGLSVWAIYPRARHLSSNVRAFVDFLAARFGRQPYWDQ